MFLLLFAFALPVLSFAQLEVKEAAKKTVIGTVKNGGKIRAQFVQFAKDVDTTYAIFYLNAAYEYINEYEHITFLDDNGTVEKLYDLMKTFFDKERIVKLQEVLNDQCYN